jgi:hypothetical protein
MQPLNMRSHFIQGLQRLQRDFPDLRLGERPGTRNLAFNQELWHYRNSLQQKTRRQASDVSEPRVATLRAAMDGHLYEWLTWYSI